MEPRQSGWWGAATPENVTDYAVTLDGDGPFPDPRSPFQPAGVHGPSRVVDHSTYQWSDSGWQPPPLSSAVVYELHIGTFTASGTFDAAIARIPHLQRLGVTHVEMMPVAEFSGEWGWGYDGVGLYAPHHAYGGPQGLKRFVDALHAAGLAAILDVVYNHLGPSGNYLAQFGPYFTDRVRTPWGDGVNFSHSGSDPVRSFFIDNALMWLRDYHFDGLRLDAVHAIADDSAVHFLEELAAAVRRLEADLGRPLAIVAESDLNDPRLIRSPKYGGYGLDAQWSDDFHHALHTVLTGEKSGYYADFGSLRHLAKAIEHGFVYDGQYSAFRDRRHGRPLAPDLKNRLLGYLQNHDQIGNRARGDRITHLTSIARAKIGAAIVLLGPFIPLVFQGEEWAAGTPFQYFTDHSDPALGLAISAGRRAEFASFGWAPADVPDPQDAATFQRSKLDWRELDALPHRDMLGWYTRLIALRASIPALESPDAAAVFDESTGLFIMHRPGLSVACNFGAEPVALRPHHAALLLASSPQIRWDRDSAVLAPDSVAIVGARVEEPATMRAGSPSAG